MHNPKKHRSSSRDANKVITQRKDVLRHSEHEGRLTLIIRLFISVLLGFLLLALGMEWIEQVSETKVLFA